MIDRLIHIFAQNGAEEVVVIINNEVPLTKAHLHELEKNSEVPLRVVVKTTPSSMHSFYELSRYLKDDRFCLTTVDTIFREEEFARFIEAFKAYDGDGMMAVTDYIDDERPLYVGVGENDLITGFHDTYSEGLRYISGGIYGLTPNALPILRRCLEQGNSRMRNFQRALVAEGCRLKAWRFSKVLDIDHATDIAKAEEFLSGDATCG